MGMDQNDTETYDMDAGQYEKGCGLGLPKGFPWGSPLIGSETLFHPPK